MLGRQRAGGVGEGVLQGPEHEGERRAELVADIGEEGRLGPVQFGEPLGALLLLLQGPHAHHVRGHLAREQLEEVAVLLVQGQAGAEPHHEHRVVRAVTAQRQGQEQGAAHGLWPGARLDRSHESLHVLDEPLLARAQHLGERPRAGVRSERELPRRRGAARLQPGVEREPHPVRLHAIEEGEGDVRAVLGEHLAGRAQDALHILGPGGADGQLAHGLEAPRAEHLPRRLIHDRDDARELAVLVSRGNEGPGEVALLQEAPALEEDEAVLDVRAAQGSPHVFEQGLEGIPGLGEDPLHGLAHGPGVLAANEGTEGVVVEEDVPGPRLPIETNGIGRGEHRADRDAQGGGPALHGTQGRLAPVHGAHERAHLSPIRQDALLLSHDGFHGERRARGSLGGTGSHGGGVRSEGLGGKRCARSCASSAG